MANLYPSTHSPKPPVHGEQANIIAAFILVAFLVIAALACAYYYKGYNMNDQAAPVDNTSAGSVENTPATPDSTAPGVSTKSTTDSAKSGT